MRPIPIYLAVEDDLSEWVLRRILSDRPVDYAVGPVFKRGGFGYLKKKAPALNKLATSCPVLLLTDLDDQPCPAGLLEEWLDQPRQRDFLLRVAVREVEAWLIASEEELGRFFGIRRRLSMEDPEMLGDPKAELLKVASSSPRRQVREAIVRRSRNGNLLQGPAYNSTLADFVMNHWNVEASQTRSRSLAKVLDALSGLEARHGED